LARNDGAAIHLLHISRRERFVCLARQRRKSRTASYICIPQKKTVRSSRISRTMSSFFEKSYHVVLNISISTKGETLPEGSISRNMRKSIRSDSSPLNKGKSSRTHCASESIHLSRLSLTTCSRPLRSSDTGKNWKYPPSYPPEGRSKLWKKYRDRFDIIPKGFLLSSLPRMHSRDEHRDNLS
jgi:hypothetical protein